MFQSAHRSRLLIIVLAVLSLSLWGCSGGEDHAERAETGHEGHDHGPGEHSIAPAAEPGHEGHDHGPGEHGVAEANIFDWCEEHSVPESQCTQCHPELIDSFKETGDWCAGHGIPESHCRLCNPGIEFPQEEVLRARAVDLSDETIEVSLYFRPNAQVCATDGAIIQFASAKTVERSGLSVQTVRAGEFESIIDAPAETVFDETKATVVTSTVPCLVSRWLVSPGDDVRAGDVLAVMQSPEIAELKSSLVAARADFEVEQKELDRHKQLLSRDLISQSEYDRQESITAHAKATLVSTRGLLVSAGMSQRDVDEILVHDEITNQFVLRAPGEGMVVERIAQLGELVEEGRPFAILADPTAMWVEADLTEEQVRLVREGQQLTFVSDGRGLNRVGGEVIWISRFLDPHTRMATVRARVMDPNHTLQAGEFGRVRIVHAEDTSVHLVPKDAVQWEGCCNVVFVRETDTKYRPRKVNLIDGNGPFYQVTGGVESGQQVVVDGAFLLKTELKKSSIGAGCCGLEPVG